MEAFGNANATTFSGVKAVNLTVSGPCGTTLYVWLELVGRVGTSEWKWVFIDKRLKKSPQSLEGMNAPIQESMPPGMSEWGLTSHLCCWSAGGGGG